MGSESYISNHFLGSFFILVIICVCLFSDLNEQCTNLIKSVEPLNNACMTLLPPPPPLQVLMYGSASVAEELCQLNRWDKCSLPINALESALELRQLDTLAFFLKSRDTGQ